MQEWLSRQAMLLGREAVERLEQARGQRDNKSRLYQSLGAVSGIGCVLLLL